MKTKPQLVKHVLKEHGVTKKLKLLPVPARIVVKGNGQMKKGKFLKMLVKTVKLHDTLQFLVPRIKTLVFSVMQGVLVLQWVQRKNQIVSHVSRVGIKMKKVRLYVLHAQKVAIIQRQHKSIARIVFLVGLIKMKG